MKPTKVGHEYYYNKRTGRTAAAKENKQTGGGWWEIFARNQEQYSQPGDRRPEVMMARSIKTALRYAAARGLDVDNTDVKSAIYEIEKATTEAQESYIATPNHANFERLREAQRKLTQLCSDQGVSRTVHGERPPTQEASETFATQFLISLNQLQTRGVKIEDLSVTQRHEFVELARERANEFALSGYEPGHGERLTELFHQERALLDLLTAKNETAS